MEVPITVTGTMTGTATLPDQPPAPPAGGGSVLEGLAGGSQSFPAISGFAGYGCLYIDRAPNWRTIPVGFNSILTIAPGVWPPGYRVANGQNGGGFGPSGTQATGTEPIRIQPPVSGTNRVQFLTQAKILVKNAGTTSASFGVALGVSQPSQNNRPMYPYLGYAHDADLRNGMMDPETLAAGESRQVTMFRVDTCDINLDGTPPIPNWPNWAMDVNAQTLLFPAVAIAFRNMGTVPLQVGNIFAVGVVL